MVATHVYADDPDILWENTFDAGFNERAYDGVLDPQTGHFWVFGAATTETKIAVQVIDFEPSDIQGIIGWQTQYIHGESNTLGKAGYMDASGNVYVSGYWDNGTYPDFFVVKYSGEHPQWSTTYSSGYPSLANSVTADNEGNVYITGTTNKEGNHDVTTVKFNSDGQHVWSNTYDSGGDDYTAGIHPFGNDYLKAFLSSVSTEPEVHDVLSAVFDITDGDLTTYILPTIESKPIPVRYHPKLSFKQYSKGNFSSSDLRTYYVIGYHDNGANKDFWFAKIEEDSVVWEKLFDSGYDDVPYAMAIDAYYVYVAGYSDNGTDKDFRIIRYDFDGNETWNITYDHGADEEAHGLGVDSDGDLYVTGYTDDGENADILTLKYAQGVAVCEQPTPFSPTLEIAVNLTSSPTIHYSLPAGSSGTLTFYSVDGRTVDEISVASSASSITWDAEDIPAGVYISVLRSGNLSAKTKIVLTK